MAESSICQSCGACCATFRVSFYCGEQDGESGGIGMIPAGLVTQITQVMACMRGTEIAPRRCVALRGEIGSSVSCSIYEFRPSPCRDFAPLADFGRGDEACADARKRHGLPSL